MSYRIQSGDTLSGIAQRYHSSVGAFMKANPQIKNANLIYAGASLNIPGKKDTFEPGNGGGHTGGTGTTGGATGTTGGTGPATSAFKLGMSELGKNAHDLKLEHSPVGKAMQDWVPDNINCANFVSGVLVAAGQIPQSEQSAGCLDLQSKLDKDPNFKRVSLKNAVPGDVVTFDTGDGHHTVMYAGMKNGKPQFLGSNNINSDGTQQISVRNMNYQILSIQHYVG